MALESAIGTLTQPGSTGNQSVTSLSFQPKVVYFFGSNLTADGVGTGATGCMGVSVSSTNRYCYCHYNDNLPSPTKRFEDVAIVFITDDVQTIGGRADFVSMNSDGFTINWSATDTTARVINWIALGGADISNVEAFTFISPVSTTGTQDVTGLGFVPDFVHFMGAHVGTPPSGDSWMEPMMGAAVSTTVRAVAAHTCAEPSNDSIGYSDNAACLAVCDKTTTAIRERADFSSFLSGPNGFQVNWSTSDATQYRFFGVAMQVTSKAVGSFTQETSAASDSVISSLNFQPKVLFFTGVKTPNNATLFQEAGIFFGGAVTTTSRFAVSYDNQDAAADDAEQGLDTAACIQTISYTSGAVDNEGDLKALSSTGFTIDWITVNTNANYIHFIALGESGSTTADVTKTMASGSAVNQDVTDTIASGSSVKDTLTDTLAGGAAVGEILTATKASGSSITGDTTTTIASGSAVLQSPIDTIASGASVLESPTLTKSSGASVQDAPTVTKASGSTIVGDASTTIASGSAVTQDVTTTKSSGASIKSTGGASVSSTFDGTEDPLSEGGNWTTATAWSAAKKSGGAARAKTATDDALVRWTGTTLNNQNRRTTITYEETVAPGFAIAVGACDRLQADGTGYVVRWLESSSQIRISRITGLETFSDLETIGSQTLVNGDTLAIEVDGSTIRAFKNDVQVGSDQTDSTHGSGDPGFLVYAFSATDFTDFGITQWISSELGLGLSKESGSSVTGDVTITKASGSTVTGDVTATKSSGSAVEQDVTLTKASGADVQAGGDVTKTMSSGSTIVGDVTDTRASGSTIVGDVSISKSSGSSISGDVSVSKAAGSSIKSDVSVSKASGAGVSSGTTVSSSFDGSENPLSEGGNWTKAVGWANLQKISGFVHSVTAGSDSIYRWTGQSIGTNEQYAQVKISHTSGSLARTCGAVVRTDSAGNGYLVKVNPRNGWVRIDKVVGVESFETFEEIAVGSVVGDVYKIEVTGSSPAVIKVYKNGSQIGSDQSDTTSPYTSGLPGIYLYNASTTATAIGIDDFQSGPISATTDESKIRVSGATVVGSASVSMSSGAEVSAGGVTHSLASGVTVVGDASVSLSSGAAVQGNQQSSVTRHDITWTFDQSYTVGQYVMGDWWVYNNGQPVTVNSTTPAQVYSGTHSSIRNGSMVDPILDNGHNYDGRGNYQSQNDNPVETFPITLQPGQSMLTAKSLPTIASSSNKIADFTGALNTYARLQQIEILTCVREIPADNSFRPPYVNGTKTLGGLVTPINKDKFKFTTDDIDWSKIPNLTPVVGNPINSDPAAILDDVEFAARCLERPQIYHCTDFTGRESHPIDQMRNYHQDVLRMMVDCAVLACQNNTTDKTQLIYGLVQAGIDAAGAIDGRIRQVPQHVNYDNGQDGGDGRIWRWPDSSVPAFLPILVGRILNSTYLAGLPKEWSSARGAEHVYEVSAEAETPIPEAVPDMLWTGHDSNVGYRHNGDPKHENEHIHPSNWWRQEEAAGLGVHDSGGYGEQYRRENTPNWPAFWAVIQQVDGGPFYPRGNLVGRYIIRWIEEGQTHDDAVRAARDADQENPVDGAFGGVGGAISGDLQTAFVNAYLDLNENVGIAKWAGVNVVGDATKSMASGADVAGGGGPSDVTTSVAAGAAVTGDATDTIASGATVLDSLTISKASGAAIQDAPTVSKASGAEVIGAGEVLTTVPSGSSVLDDAVTTQTASGAAVLEELTHTRASGGAVQDAPTHTRASGSTVVGDATDSSPAGASVLDSQTTSLAGGSAVSDSPTDSLAGGSAVTSDESISKASGTDVLGVGDVSTSISSGASITGAVTTTLPGGASLLEVFQTQLASGSAIESDKSTTKASGAEVVLPDEKMFTVPGGSSITSPELVSVGCGSSITDATTAQFASGAAVGYKNETGINRGWFSRIFRLRRGWRGRGW